MAGVKTGWSETWVKWTPSSLSSMPTKHLKGRSSPAVRSYM